MTLITPTTLGYCGLRWLSSRQIHVDSDELSSRNPYQAILNPLYLSTTAGPCHCPILPNLIWPDIALPPNTLMYTIS